MSPSSNPTRRPRRRVGGAAALVLVALALATPTPASALPPVTTAAVVAFQTPVVPFTGGTADLDGATTLENTQTGTKSRLDSTLLFAKDSDRLRPGAQQKLHQLALQLQHQGPGHLQVTGYTDDLGSAAHGLDLSQRRARRVADELRNTLPANRYPITVDGRGEADPAVPNTNETNRRKNRRVNVTLTRNPTQTAPATTSTSQPTASTLTTTIHSTTATSDETPHLTASTTAAQQTTAKPSPTSAYTTSQQTVQAPPEPTRETTPTLPPPSPLGHRAWPLTATLAAGLIVVGALADLIRRRRTPPPTHTADPTAPPHPDPPTSPPTATTDQTRPNTDPSATPPATGAHESPQTSTNRLFLLEVGAGESAADEEHA